MNFQFQRVDSIYNLRGGGVNLGLTMFGLNWMKFSFTCKVDKVWNSLKLKLREKNLSKFTTTIRKETLKVMYLST